MIKEEGKVFIAIEAKINAPEQPKQLSDYADYSEKMNKTVGFIPVLFLTPKGRDSEEETPRNRYEPISFEKDIVSWLEACLELPETKKAAPVREVITQYIKAIKSFCGNMEDEAMEKEINKLVLESEESYAAALQISKVVKELDGKVMQIFENQIFNLVRKKFSDMNHDNKGWYEIKLGNIIFSVYYNMVSFQVQKAKTSDSVSSKKKDAIISIMSKKTNGDRNSANNKMNIWVSNKARDHYPGLEGYEGDMYFYKLYQIYSKEKGQQAVADWIVSIATELEQIKE